MKKEQCSGKYHKRKDCWERPRKVLARYANSLVVHDEHIVQDEAVNYDEKRDRWSSYDPANHREIIEEYEKVEEGKRQLKAEKLKNDPDAEISDDDGNEKWTCQELKWIKNNVLQYATYVYVKIPPSTSVTWILIRPIMTPQPDPCGTIQIHKYQQKSQSLTVKILFALPETPQNMLVLNCSHGRLMVRGSMFIYWLSLLSWSCYKKEYEKKKEQFKSSTKEHIVEKYGGEEPSIT
ncbi:pre-mRNA-splicing factor Slu7-like [Glossina fuscipes fuscipes]